MEKIQYIEYLFWVGYTAGFLMLTCLIILALYVLFDNLLRFKRIRSVFRKHLLYYDVKEMNDNEFISLIHSIRMARK